MAVVVAQVAPVAEVVAQVGRRHGGRVIVVVVAKFVLVQGAALLRAVQLRDVATDLDVAIRREAELALSVVGGGALWLRQRGSVMGGSAGHVEGWERRRRNLL